MRYPPTGDLGPSELDSGVGIFPAVLLVQLVLGAAFIAGTLLALRLTVAVPLSRHAGAACPSPWPGKRMQLEQWLARHPGDHGARLKLAAVLVNQALLDAQNRYAAENDPAPDWEPEAYQAHVIRALALSPEVAAARVMARKVAQTSPDRRLRARAWAKLAVLSAHLGDKLQHLACLRKAYREHPCSDYGEAIARHDLALYDGRWLPPIRGR